MWLRFDVIDPWAAGQGAESDTAIASLLGVDRATVWRFRHRLLIPSLPMALRIAQKVGVSVDDLVASASTR